MLVLDDPTLEEQLEYAKGIFLFARTDTLGDIPPNLSSWKQCVLGKQPITKSRKKLSPYHLHFDIIRIATEWEKHRKINNHDRDYIDTVCTKPIEWLARHAYVLNKWVAFPTAKPIIHNLRPRKRQRR